MKKKTISNMEDLLTCGYFDFEGFYKYGGELDEELIGKYLDVLPLGIIFKHQRMTEEFLNEHFVDLSDYMPIVLETHELSEYMLEKILELYKSSKMENSSLLSLFPIHQKLSQSFVEKHEDEINWASFSTFQKIDDPDFVNKYMDKISWINVRDNIKMTEEAFIEKYMECGPDVFRYQRFSKEFIKNLDLVILDYFFGFDSYEGWNISSNTYKSWMNLLIYQNMDCEFFEEWWDNIRCRDEFLLALIRFNKLTEEFMEAHWNDLSRTYMIPAYQKFSLDFYNKHKLDLDASNNIGWYSFENGEIPPEVSFDNLY